jgi:hypothetical protein
MCVCVCVCVCVQGAGIATAYGLDGGEVAVRVPVGSIFIQIGSGAHPTSYPMGTGGSFPGGKVAGA